MKKSLEGDACKISGAGAEPCPPVIEPRHDKAGVIAKDRFFVKPSNLIFREVANDSHRRIEGRA